MKGSGCMLLIISQIREPGAEMQHIFNKQFSEPQITDAILRNLDEGNLNARQFWRMNGL
jgi:hypothetical protein